MNSLLTVTAVIIMCLAFQCILLADSQSLSAPVDVKVVDLLPEIFCVDVVNGDDDMSGSISKPFRTLNKALDVVSNRVNLGITSDKIYLRAGVYRNDGFSNAADRDFILYNVNLKGTASAPSVISAMPCAPDTTGCIQRKSGEWYEKVDFDDGYIIPSGIWTKYNNDIWMSKPGYNGSASISRNRANDIGRYYSL